MSQPLLKKKRASPQNAKLKIFLRVKLYLKSETNFFSLLVFTGSQGSKNWRRTRHHDATFVMKTKRHIKNDTNIFLFCLLGAPQDGDSNLWFFFLGFLLEPGQRPLAGQTLIQNFNQLFRYRNTCIKQVSPKTKNLQMKNQRFQFWRLSADYDIICQAWPSQARSSQILAIKKSKTFEPSPPFYWIWKAL